MYVKLFHKFHIIIVKKKGKFCDIIVKKYCNSFFVLFTIEIKVRFVSDKYEYTFDASIKKIHYSFHISFFYFIIEYYSCNFLYTLFLKFARFIF